jgi:hypothetical protein
MIVEVEGSSHGLIEVRFLQLPGEAEESARNLSQDGVPAEVALFEHKGTPLPID